MKKIFYLFLFTFVAVSCTEDVKFNTPAFQALKDNVFWRAQNYSAYTSTTGVLVIEGSLGAEKVSLKLPSANPGTYFFGDDELHTASYSNIFSSDTPQFTTGANKGSGQIVITEINTEAKTISGTFKFTAVNTAGENAEKPSIVFTEGVFYKIPFAASSNF